MGGRSLLCRVQGRLCALPLQQVVETLRPLPVEPLSGAPGFVRGIAIIRGAPLPVVDVAALLGAGEGRVTRFVVLRSGQHHVALAVDEVVGVRALDERSLGELPPLLRGGDDEAIASIGARDAELLMVLDSARMIPDSLWTSLELEPAPP